jgi:hypothetical protein
MAKLRLQNEWKMWIGFGVLFGIIALYLYFVSRPPTEGGEYLWKVTKVQDVNRLSLKGSGNNLEFKIMGLKIAASMEAPVREYLVKNLENQWIRIKVLREGPKDTKEGLVFLSGEDILARMVRQGLAEIDRDERAFDVRPYLELEQEAKREKKGMWSNA